MVPIYLAYISECLAYREWHYLKGLGNVALLEEVSLAMGFEGSKAQARSQYLLAVVDQATSPAPCLPICCQASHYNENPRNCEKFPIKCFPL